MATSTAAESLHKPVILVKIGTMKNYFVSTECSASMYSSQVVDALALSTFFGKRLHGMNLAECTVFFMGVAPPLPEVGVDIGPSLETLHEALVAAVGEAAAEAKQLYVFVETPPVDDAAARGLQDDVDSFTRLLGRASERIVPDKAVLERLIRHKAGLLPWVQNAAHAARLYKWAEGLLTTTTRQRFAASSHIVIGDQLPDSDAVFEAFNSEGQPLVFKGVAKGEAELELVAACDVSGGPNLVSCSQVSIPRADGTTSIGLIMPRYVLSLASASFPRPAAALLPRAREMIAALTHLHSCGWVHMDIKSPNILIDQSGSWWLGDFGSCVRQGEPVRSTSRGLHPDFNGWMAAVERGAEPSDIPAAFCFDWWSMAWLIVQQLYEAEARAELLGAAPVMTNESLSRAIAGVELAELREVLARMMACTSAGLD